MSYPSKRGGDKMTIEELRNIDPLANLYSREDILLMIVSIIFILALYLLFGLLYEKDS